MERRPPAWSDRLHPEWIRHGIEHLAERGIEDSKYRNKVIKERLMDSMAVPYILALIEHAGADADAVARLGWHRGTPNRWLKNETQPHAREFFGLLLVGLRKEISEVPLPTSRKAIGETVGRTLAIIREKECDEERRQPTWEELMCVRWFHRHPHSNTSLGNVFQITAGDVIEDVARKLSHRFPLGAWTYAAVGQAADEWALPYVLFRIGLLDGWEFLDAEVL